MHPAHVGIIVERDSATKPFFERLLEERRFVELGKHFRDGRPCDVARDAERLQLLNDASLAALAQPDFRARTSEGCTPIVERLFAA